MRVGACWCLELFFIMLMMMVVVIVKFKTVSLQCEYGRKT